MDLRYEQDGDRVTATTSGTPKEIAGLVAALQDRQEGARYALTQEPYQTNYSPVKTNLRRNVAIPCEGWSDTPVDVEEHGKYGWRRFDLHLKEGPIRDELYQLLDRLHLTRRELALIVLGLRVRPEFSLADFDT